jgi:hypothetical protein
MGVVAKGFKIEMAMGVDHREYSVGDFPL